MSQPALRLLLVDDDPINIYVLRGLLGAALGRLQVVCEIEDVRDGASAVERAQRRGYDLICMDLMMPGMDGYEASARILASRPGQRIIAVTADVRSEARLRCRDLGMSGFLGKPVDERHLVDALREQCPGAIPMAAAAD